MGTKAPAEGATDRVDRVLQALGSAWATYTLYPDPAGQPAFVRAAAVLAREVEDGIELGVGPGHFLWGDEPVEVAREGAGRLARELFLHDVELLRLRTGLALESLLTFFGALSRDEEHLSELGGLGAVLAAAPPLGIEIVERGLLRLGDEFFEDIPAEEDDADLAGVSAAVAAAQRGAPPAEVAALLVDEFAEPPQRVGAFVEGIEVLLQHAEAASEVPERPGVELRQGVGDPWSGLRIFLEAFLHLGKPLQTWILEAVLADRDKPANRIFLDQLSDVEIGEFMGDLDGDAAAALAAYATVVASEAGRPQVEDAELPDEAAPPQATRRIVAARISEVLRTGAASVHVDEGLRDLKALMSEPLPTFELGRGVIRGLIECEAREDRFHRVARVWAARVTRQMRDGDFARAEQLLADVLDKQPATQGMRRAIDEAVERIAGRDSLQFLLQHHDGPNASEEASAVIARLGSKATDALVSMLADADEPTERRLLIDLLATSIRSDPTMLDGYIGRFEWYVLRNLATALGATERRGTVPTLRRLLAHDHHEVRIEAMRALVRVLGRDAAPHLTSLLEDPHERVRQAAASLVRASDHEELDQLLLSRLESGRLDAEIAVVVVRILAARGRPEGVEAVRRLAQRRFAVGKRARHVRAAAREALEGTP